MAKNDLYIHVCSGVRTCFKNDVLGRDRELLIVCVITVNRYGIIIHIHVKITGRKSGIVALMTVIQRNQNSKCINVFIIISYN